MLAVVWPGEIAVVVAVANGPAAFVAYGVAAAAAAAATATAGAIVAVHVGVDFDVKGGPGNVVHAAGDVADCDQRPLQEVMGSPSRLASSVGAVATSYSGVNHVELAALTSARHRIVHHCRSYQAIDSSMYEEALGCHSSQGLRRSWVRFVVAWLQDHRHAVWWSMPYLAG